MDTSETYIKMCDCEEIQGWINKLDFVPRCCNEIVYSGDKVFWDGTYPNGGSHVIWLPRQDQLQEMVDGGFTHQTLERFYRWYNSGIELCLSSMEQLWLAFVMKEKYNKIWSGEGWFLVIN